MILFWWIYEDEKYDWSNDAKYENNKPNRYGVGEGKDDNYCGLYDICDEGVDIHLPYPFGNIETITKKILPNKKKNGNGSDV